MAKKCYGCGTPLVKADAEEWGKTPFLQDLCPRCVALVEGRKRSGSMMKRCSGYPSRPDRIEERRAMREEWAAKMARKVAAGSAKAKSKKKGKAKAKPKKKEKKLPTDPEAVGMSKNGPTVVVTGVLCNMCGEPNAIPKTTTASYIQSTCSKCGALIKVVGGKLVKLRVPRKDIKKAEQTALVPTETGDGKKASTTGRKAQDFTTMRFRMTLDQHKVIRMALEIARRISHVEGKEWQGTTLEHICADFLAGDIDPAVQKAVQEEMDSEG